MWKKQFEEELKDLREEINILKNNSHPPRKFVVCENCKQKIKEK